MSVDPVNRSCGSWVYPARACRLPLSLGVAVDFKEAVLCQSSFLWCLPSMLLTSFIQRWQDIGEDIQSDTPPGNAKKLPASLSSLPLLKAVRACRVSLEYFYSGISDGLYATFRLSRYPCMVCKAPKTMRRK